LKNNKSSYEPVSRQKGASLQREASAARVAKKRPGVEDYENTLNELRQALRWYPTYSILKYIIATVSKLQRIFLSYLYLWR
jgi:hypothetical protein